MVTKTAPAKARGPTAARGDAGLFRKRHLRRWRVACLLAIHLLFALHFVHWRLRGTTLSPLEFSESLHTLHDGILTAGFVFALLAVAGTLVFGRFFCGWGCHILALQDGCAWILGKLGIRRPKPVRSRAMALVPLGIMTYIYLWPQFVRLAQHSPYPGLRIVRAADGWGSFLTRDLFRAMPGPVFSVLTLAVCGAATVYFLGSRSFCYSVCPYGVFFGWAEKAAPGARLVLSGACENCGLCTLNCKSGVKVIQELKSFGTVVDTNCLKSLDCVAGCPNGAIGLGFRLPWTRTGPSAPARGPGKRRFDFTRREEFLFLFAFSGVFLVYRGLYETGIFLAATVGAVAGAGAVKWFRESRGRAARAGWPIRCLRFAFFALTAHGAYVHYHAYAGQRAFAANPDDPLGAMHLRKASAYGWFLQPGVERDLALAAARGGDLETAAGAFSRYLKVRPNDVLIRVRSAEALARMGRGEAADRELEKALIPDAALASDQRPWRATAYSLLARSRATAGDTGAAEIMLAKAQADDPADATHACNLAFLRIRRGRSAEARQILDAARIRLGTQPCMETLARMAAGDPPGAPPGAD